MYKEDDKGSERTRWNVKLPERVAGKNRLPPVKQYLESKQKMTSCYCTYLQYTVKIVVKGIKLTLLPCYCTSLLSIYCTVLYNNNTILQYVSQYENEHIKVQ